MLKKKHINDVPPSQSSFFLINLFIYFKKYYLSMVLLSHLKGVPLSQLISSYV